MKGYLDPNKPATQWLGDVCNDFANKLRAGEEPTLDVICGEVTLEIRLAKCPGYEVQRVLIDELKIGGSDGKAKTSA